MAEERVTLEDTVAVLAKHAKLSGAPDDQEVLSRYLEQEEEAHQEVASKPATGKGPK
jgi:hypothetical protein